MVGRYWSLDPVCRKHSCPVCWICSRSSSSVLQKPSWRSIWSVTLLFWFDLPLAPVGRRVRVHLWVKLEPNGCVQSCTTCGNSRSTNVNVGSVRFRKLKTHRAFPFLYAATEFFFSLNFKNYHVFGLKNWLCCIAGLQSVQTSSQKNTLWSFKCWNHNLNGGLWLGRGLAWLYHHLMKVSWYI